MGDEVITEVKLYNVDMAVNSYKTPDNSVDKLTWCCVSEVSRPKRLQFYKQQLVVSFHLLDAIVTMNSVGVSDSLTTHLNA